MLVLILAILGVGIATFVKLSKKCKSKSESFMKVGDIGPSAGGQRVSKPPSQVFQQQCLQAFQNQPSDGSPDCSQNTVPDDQGTGSYGNNICGNDSGAICQDNSNMNDTRCSGAPYVAYQASDCAQPFVNAGGYLCGDNGSGSCPAPLGSNVGGSAPPNPWGCTNVCQ